MGTDGGYDASSLESVKVEFARRLGTLGTPYQVHRQLVGLSHDVTLRSVTRWFGGESLPRPDLADALDHINDRGFARLRLEGVRARPASPPDGSRGPRRVSRTDDGADSSASFDFDAELIDVDKVETLRWEALSPSERRSLWQRFCELQAQVVEPVRWPITTVKDQEFLHKRRPIEVGPLRAAAVAFGVDPAPFALPMRSEEDYPALTAVTAELRALVRTAAADDGFTPDQRSALGSVFAYLRCSELELTLDAGRRLDLVCVLGGRPQHRDRAHKARDLLRAADGDPLVALSGHRPRFVTSQEWTTISEADAIEFVLRNEPPLDFDLPADRVIFDRKATSIRDSAQFLGGVVQRASFELGRALNVAIVTGPFALRRAVLLLSAAMDRQAPSIASLAAVPSIEVPDFSTYLRKKQRNAQTFAIDVYITEYMKLLAGRAVGEF